jgi:hypothetical protein
MHYKPQNDLKMTLEIRGEIQLSDLQFVFNGYFPFLKIEFFKIPHKIGEGLAKSLLFDNKKLVKDCRTVHEVGELIFDETMKVSAFEAKLQDEFGLSVQVFRKSGNVWLETSATDTWTLREQNDEGAELETKFKE